jgi:hypothetical protein
VLLTAFTNEKKKECTWTLCVILQRRRFPKGHSRKKLIIHCSSDAPDPRDFSFQGQSWWLCPKLLLFAEAG